MILKFLRNPFAILAGLALIIYGSKIILKLPESFLEVSFIVFLFLLIALGIIGQLRESRKILIESELRRMENEKSIILDSILDVVVYFNPDYKILWQSRNAESSGLNHQFRHTNQCCRTWHGQSIACEGCAIHFAMTNRKAGEGEITTDDGKTWWIRTYPVFNEQHQFSGLIEFSSDITKIKQAEHLVRRYTEELEITVQERTRELKELNLRLQKEIDDRKSFENALLQSKNKFSSVITHSPYGIYLTDTEGIVVEWNGAMEDITGIDKKDALGSYVWDVYRKLVPETEYPQMNLVAYKHEFKELLAVGSSVFYPPGKGQNMEITPAGKTKTVHSHRFTIRGEKGFKVAAHVRDVTHDLIQEAAIRDREAKLSTIFDNTYQGFILLDLEGRLLEMNRQGKKYLHLYNPGIQRYDFMESALPDDYKEIFRKLFAMTLNEKTLRTQVKLPFTKHISRWFDIHMSVVQGEGEICSGVFINAVDINEQTKADQEMQKALEMEKDLNRLRAHFVSSVSHEFRTPLASIYSNTQLLKRYDNKWDDTKKGQTFERIFSSIHHMTSLLQDVSLLGKGQSGMYKFQPDKTDIIAFCHQMKEDVINSSASNAVIEFHTDIPHLEVSIDINLVRHVLVNVLNNACKYSPAGETVIFGLTCHDRKLQFEIKDQGIGIPEDDLPHIFEPFYRAGNVGKIQGSGLGMAVVKQCVDIHNGEIFIDSKHGKGTTVNVLLPCIF